MSTRPWILKYDYFQNTIGHRSYIVAICITQVSARCVLRIVVCFLIDGNLCIEWAAHLFAGPLGTFFCLNFEINLIFRIKAHSPCCIIF